MAGGYDDRVVENVEHYEELRRLVIEKSLDDHVSFVRSCSAAQKLALLRRARCLLYTPSREHFGIVPIEAMYMECPVVAANSGGPLETIADGETGYLCNADAESFAKAIERLIRGEALAKKMGVAGKKRVLSKFSFASFSDQLNRFVMDLYRR